MPRPKGSKNKNNPATKAKKEAWQLLENHMTGDFTQKMITIMNKYYREHKYEDFIKIYNTLVKYFKPQMKATEIDMKSDIVIRIEGNEKLIDKI